MHKISVPIPKARNKALNDVLTTRKGGRMSSPRDFDRQALKRDLQKQLNVPNSL